MVGEAIDCPACGKVIRIMSGRDATAFDEDPLPLVRVQSGPSRVGEAFALAGDTPIEIGKLQEHPLSLLGSRVSRTHCRLLKQNGHWLIEDNKSTNGLFVNGKRVTTRQALASGDVLTVGDFELEYHDSAPAAAADETEEVEEASGGVDLDSIDDAYDFVEEPAIVRPVAAAKTSAPQVKLGADAIACPSCATKYPPTAQVCTNCGINIKTGRAILITREIDENALAIRAQNMLSVFSWIARIGVYPISSEGHGEKKPFVTWGLAAAITIATIAVWLGTITHSMSRPNNLLLWAGRTPTVDDIEEARAADFIESSDDEVDAQVTDKSDEAKAAASDDSDDSSDDGPVTKPRLVKAHVDAPTPKLKPTKIEKVKPEVALANQPYFGHYDATQLVTNGFIHGNLTRWTIFQLIRNIVFLMVFGSAVNALIGQWRMGVLYVLVLIVGSVAFLWIEAGGPPTVTSGANAAVMGLAGAYLVLFPIHKMHIVAWRRKGMRSGFELAMKIFQVRGVWVVLACVALDVLMTMLITHGGIDWIAHLCGFGAGMVGAMILLIARQADANRTDMISLVLGKSSWALLGKPGSAVAG
jgi:membrane associated rhomboid family serine protease